jgi:hypothetical protein
MHNRTWAFRIFKSKAAKITFVEEGRKYAIETADGSQEFFASSLEWTVIGSQYLTDNIVFLNFLGEKSDKIRDVSSSSLCSATSLT